MNINEYFNNLAVLIGNKNPPFILHHTDTKPKKMRKIHLFSLLCSFF